MEDPGYQEFADYIAGIEEGDEIYDLYVEVVGLKKREKEGTANFSTGIIIGAGCVFFGAILWPLAGIWLDYLRSHAELSAVERKMRIITEAHEKTGLPIDIIEPMVNRLVEKTSNLNEKNSAFKKILTAANNIKKLIPQSQLPKLLEGKGDSTDADK